MPVKRGCGTKSSIILQHHERKAHEGIPKAVQSSQFEGIDYLNMEANAASALSTQLMPIPLQSGPIWKILLKTWGVRALSRSPEYETFHAKRLELRETDAGSVLLWSARSVVRVCKGWRLNAGSPRRAPFKPSFVRRKASSFPLSRKRAKSLKLVFRPSDHKSGQSSSRRLHCAWRKL